MLKTTLLKIALFVCCASVLYAPYGSTFKNHSSSETKHEKRRQTRRKNFKTSKTTTTKSPKAERNAPQLAIKNALEELRLDEEYPTDKDQTNQDE